MNRKSLKSVYDRLIPTNPHFSHDIYEKDPRRFSRAGDLFIKECHTDAKGLRPVFIQFAAPAAGFCAERNFSTASRKAGSRLVAVISVFATVPVGSTSHMVGTVLMP